MGITYYDTGTATLSVGAGAKTMTGQGTLWAGWVKPGDQVIPQEGTANVVDVVVSNTEITLLKPYRGVAQVAQPYTIMRTPDVVFTESLARKVLQDISGSALVALAGLTAEARKGIRFGATSAAETFTFTDKAVELVGKSTASDMLSVLGLAVTTFAKTLLDDVDRAAMWGTLGLSTLAAQDATNVSIGGGSVAAQTLGVLGVNASTGPSIFTFKSANYALMGYVGVASSDLNTSLVGSLGNVNLFPVPANAVVNIGSTSTANAIGSAGVTVYKNGSAGSFSTHLVNGGAGGTALLLSNTDATYGAVCAFYKGGSPCGSITTTTTTTSFNTSSDYRLKPTVEPLVEFTLTPDQFAMLPAALLRIMSLCPVRHNWVGALDTWMHGFIAHEAQPVVPHAVTGTKDEEEDIGTAIVPEHTVEAGTDEEGQPILVTVPAQEFKDVAHVNAPEGSTWTKTGTRPVYQGMDPSKMVADLTAGIQALTLLVLQQAARINALEAAVGVEPPAT